jgi:menaquinone-9 beta-reductase
VQLHRLRIEELGDRAAHGRDVSRQVADVVVVGGGPAGTTVAVHLARAGASVLLCDAAFFPRHKTCGEYLPPAAIASFEGLGVLPDILRLAPRRHVGMAVIAPGGAEVLGRYGDGAPRGLSLRRFDLDAVLLANARRNGVVVLEGQRVTDLSRREDLLFDLALAPAGDGAPAGRAAGGPRQDHPRPLVRARAVVGADGRNSIVARRLGLRRPSGHRRWAVMGHFRNVRAPGDHGEMIVTPYGYCGINPLPGDLANVCIVVDPKSRAASPLGDPGPIPGKGALRAFFDRAIEGHPRTRQALAGATLADGLWTIGPIAARAARSVTDGALLVGDAAGFFDPFTGEGIAMALRGGEMAAEILADALARGDLRASRLSPYEDRRAAAFAKRLRLDRLLQRILARPRLADWVAGRLRRDQALADLLARVAGDTADAGSVLRPAFLARLLLA